MPFSKTVVLKNPYHLGRKNLLVFLYALHPNLASKAPFRTLRLLSYPLSAASLIARAYGLSRLSRDKKQMLPAYADFVDGTEKRFFRIRDTNSQFHSIYFNAFSDCYEPDVTAIIEAFLSEGSTFIDIGSNWGHHSFFAAMTKKARVVLFEPNPEVFRDVARITKELNLESSFTMHNLALSSKGGRMTLTQHYFESGIASINEAFSRQRFDSGKYEKIIKRALRIESLTYNVDVAPLDSFGLESADLIKIDAEGAELDIMKGAHATIDRLRPLIIFEFHSGDMQLYGRYRSLLSSMKYDIYAISCEKKSGEKGMYQLSLHSAEKLQPNRQYNLLAVPAERAIGSQR